MDIIDLIAKLELTDIFLPFLLTWFLGLTYLLERLKAERIGS